MCARLLLPEWLLQRRKRAERALVSVVATSYLLGVSTRRMEKLVETLGIIRLSKSQVSVMARELDEQVADFRSRPLDQGPYTFLAADALTMKVREGGRLVLVHLPIATGVNGDGHREVLGVEVASAEDGAGCLGFFRDPVARDLSGVPGYLRCPHRPGRGAALPRYHLATLSHALRPEPDGRHTQALLGLGESAAAQCL